MRTYYDEQPPCKSKETILKVIELRNEIRKHKFFIDTLDTQVSEGCITAVECAKKKADSILSLEIADKRYFDFIHGVNSN